MNKKYNQTILELVARYEAIMSEEGAVAYLEGKDYEALIDYYEQEDQLDRALEVTNLAINHHQFTADFYLRKAHILLDAGQVAIALNTLDEAILFSPAETDIILLRAEALIQLGQIDEAFALLEEMKEEAIGVEMSKIYFIEALAYETQGYFEAMYIALKSALEVDPGHREALERLWMCIEQNKKYDEAIKLHEAILDADPYSMMAWYNLGHAHAYYGNYPEAIECYEFAFVIDEDFEEAYRDCAELCFEMKLFHKAQRVYEELLEHFDPDSDLLLRLGQCYQYQEKYKIALTFFTQALNLDPLDDEVLFHMGECYTQEGNWPKAIRYFQKAISIEDTREEYFGALADAYFHHGKMPKAEANFIKAIDAAPEESRYWIRYAHFLLSNARGAKALDILDEAEENAAGAELLYCRIGCLFSLGRRQEGLYWLGEALAEDFDLHRSLFDFLPELEADPDIVSMISAYTA